jgi:hypothetical protein
MLNIASANHTLQPNPETFYSNKYKAIHNSYDINQVVELKHILVLCNGSYYINLQMFIVLVLSNKLMRKHANILVSTITESTTSVS